MRIKDLLLLAAVGITIFVASCDDPAAVEIEEEAKRVADSTALANVNSDLMDAYIANSENGLADYDTSFVANFDVRIFIKNATDANAQLPESNDLVSLHYRGKLLSNDVYDASNEEYAFFSDSLAWTVKGIDFEADTIIWAGDTLIVNERSIEEILAWLYLTKDPLYYTLLSESNVSPTEGGVIQDYAPILYNHTFDGRFVASYFPLGFKTGLRALMPYLQLGGTATIIFPSVVAFPNDIFWRTMDRDGDDVGEAEYIIPNDSPIVYELDLVKIRP